MGSLAEVAAAAKTGLWQRLRTTPGLTETDGVRIASATVGSPGELSVGSQVVELGDVTIAPATRPDLVGRAGSFTVTGWVTITRPTGGEEAIQAARDRAAEVMGLVERAIATDPTVDGTIVGPGGTAVTVSALQESPVDSSGQAVRRATYPFSITWTSHVT
jgi:hypothetical protein